jgi:hypothetical protein
VITSPLGHQPPVGVVEEEEPVQLPPSWCAVELAVPGCVELLLGEGVRGGMGRNARPKGEYP